MGVQLQLPLASFMSTLDDCGNEEELHIRPRTKELVHHLFPRVLFVTPAPALSCVVGRTRRSAERRCCAGKSWVWRQLVARC